MSISEQIEIMINSMTDNNIPPKLITIVKGYNKLICDVKTDNTVLKNIPCSNIASEGRQGLLIYLNGDQYKPFILIFDNEGSVDFNDFYSKSEITQLLSKYINSNKLYEILDDYVTNQSLSDYIKQSSDNGFLRDYLTESEINQLFSSYALRSELFSGVYSDLTGKPVIPSKISQLTNDSGFIKNSELSDLDIDLTTLQLVPYESNQNGVMCFNRVQKSIDELDIDLNMDTMSNGYLKIDASLIEK